MGYDKTSLEVIWRAQPRGSARKNPAVVGILAACGRLEQFPLVSDVPSQKSRKIEPKKPQGREEQV